MDIGAHSSINAHIPGSSNDLGKAIKVLSLVKCITLSAGQRARDGCGWLRLSNGVAKNTSFLYVFLNFPVTPSRR